ncbi:MAG: hypothetical protein ACTSVY_04005, partial [Candidatus Helarchaeota archaeon]
LNQINLVLPFIVLGITILIYQKRLIINDIIVPIYVLLFGFLFYFEGTVSFFENVGIMVIIILEFLFYFWKTSSKTNKLSENDKNILVIMNLLIIIIFIISKFQIILDIIGIQTNFIYINRWEIIYIIPYTILIVWFLKGYISNNIKSHIIPNFTSKKFKIIFISLIFIFPMFFLNVYNNWRFVYSKYYDLNRIQYVNSFIQIGNFLHSNPSYNCSATISSKINLQAFYPELKINRILTHFGTVPNYTQAFETYYYDNNLTDYDVIFISTTNILSYYDVNDLIGVMNWFKTLNYSYIFENPSVLIYSNLSLPIPTNQFIY